MPGASRPAFIQPYRWVAAQHVSTTVKGPLSWRTHNGAASAFPPAQPNNSPMVLPPQVFTPPAAPTPSVVELRLPRNAGGPIDVEGHDLHCVVVGNTLLAPERIRAALLGAHDANEAIAALENLYRASGYVLVGLRAQVDADGKVVRISVIEGRITRIDAEAGIRDFYSDLLLAPDVTTNTLLKRNVLAELYASRNGEQFTPSLGPAPQPGGSALSISTPPQAGAKKLSGSVVLANYGSRYVGGYLLGENLLFHPGDGWEFAANYSQALPNLQRASAGSRSDNGGLAASRVTRWGIYSVSTQHSAYRIGVAGAPYYPQGYTDTVAIAGSQLLDVSPVGRLSVSQALTHVATQTTVLDGKYTLSDQNYNMLNLGVQASRNVMLGVYGGAINASAGATVGLSGQRGTLIYAQASAPQAHFHEWTLSANWQQALPRGWSSTLSANGQWGLDTLPSNQQWVIGGYGSASAWSPGVLSGDGGYLLRASVQGPALQWRGTSLAATAFAEQGAVTNHFNQAGTPTWAKLADVGVGVTATLPWKTQLSLYAARPVSHQGVTAAVYDNQRPFYVLLQQPF